MSTGDQLRADRQRLATLAHNGRAMVNGDTLDDALTDEEMLATCDALDRSIALLDAAIVHADRPIEVGDVVSVRIDDSRFNAMVTGYGRAGSLNEWRTFTVTTDDGERIVGVPRFALTRRS